MNLENLDTLSQKIQSMLEAMRRLKNEKANADKMIEESTNSNQALQADVNEKARRIEELQEELSNKNGELESQAAELESKKTAAESLQSTLAERDAELESLKAALAEKEEKLAEMEKIIGEQGEEIQNAQEKFQNLLSTIENELGTEIPVQAQDEENQSVEPENGEQEEPAKESAQTDFFA
ncbi:hypothetical protein [Fibrobacter intestinalis]|uniref:Uncharacterized protein n=1 Tax=Fibrobacter intestinalis TaxID=28122 RepID=A0A1M6Y6Y9_9BACT|nr:hypothetical protein [Fibrobacter intestinalis]SHL13789.1 hypothetical protein SAMN05720469_1389 [Fibrobacter intestinalis]